MNITRIQASSVLSLSDIDLKIEDRITLFAGRNGSGKSSIYDAVKLVIGKQSQAVRGISKKTDYGMLVRDGAKAGGIVVTVNDNPDESFSVSLPKGDFSGPDISDAMRVALDGQRFASMDLKERARFVLSMGKTRMSPKTILPLLEAAGADNKKCEDVGPLLLQGLDAAVTFAKAEATKEKGAWGKTTGGTWGPKIAEGWAAPVPDLPEGEVKALHEEIAAIDVQVAQLNESLGAIRQAQQQAEKDAARRTELEAAVKRVPELEKLLATAIKERDDYQKQVESLRERAKGGKQGLVHDLIRHVNSEPGDHMTKTRALEQARLLAAYAKEHGEITESGAADADALASLPEHEKGLTVLVNRAANLQRDLDSAKMAKGQYDALKPAAESVDASAEIAEINGLLEDARARRVTVANKALDIETAIKKRAEADGKTKESAQHHLNVMQWLLIADQLSPDGIPAQLLAEALAPINDCLDQAAADTSWKKVVIGADMTITVGGRLYDLESESFRWRADAMIAYAVSVVSGLRVAVLDRCDVLDLQGRAQLFAWLQAITSAEVDEIDTVLMFATLKELPSIRGVQSHWIESGAIVPWEQSERFAEIQKAA